MVRRWAVALLAPCLVALALAGEAQAQARPAQDPLARAIAYYRDLDYDAAASSLRGLLAIEGTGGLTAQDRERARMYLGASEVFRSRREAAVEQFRAILEENARFRPDQLVFPPEVSNVFQAARVGIRTTAFVVPDETRIQAGEDRLRLRVYSAAPHQVRVAITDAFGGVVRVLHEGELGDSLALEWNGRDGLGRLREPGRYLLRATSRSPEGRDERDLEVVLTIARLEQDTISLPEPLPASAFRPESTPGSGGTRFIVTGLAAAGAVAALPAVVGADTDGLGLRFGIAGLLGAAGIYGRTRAAAPRPIPENIEWNRQQRDAYARELARVRAENDMRRGVVGVMVRASAPRVVEIR